MRKWIWKALDEVVNKKVYSNLYGFSLFIFANSIKLKYMVLALAPFFVF
jgi:hypothetical protein